MKKLTYLTIPLIAIALTACSEAADTEDPINSSTGSFEDQGSIFTDSQDQSSDDSSTDDPSTDDPSTDDPSTDDPSTDDPSTDDPSTDDPSTDDPSTDDPSTDDPSTDDTTLDLVPANTYYSYDSNFSSAQPLQGAVLENRNVYFFIQSSLASSATYICCNDSNTVDSIVSSINTNNNFGAGIDLSSESAGGSRTLQYNYGHSSGQVSSTYSVNFTLSITPEDVTDTDLEISWEAPTLREDGSALDSNEISQYRVTYTTPSGSTNIELIDGASNSLSILVSDAGNYNFHIQTIDTDGNESANSNTEMYAL